MESLIKHHQMQCNRYVNGHCSTRACYMRGGYSGKGPVGNVEATCVDHEWVVMLADLDAALRRAKAEVWREAARDLIERAENCNRILTDGRRLYASDERMWTAKRELLQALVLEYSARAAQIEEGE